MNQKEIYVPKAKLIQWINETTKVPIEDLRQLSTGVHLCHLLNQLTEGKFKLGKVNKSPKTEAESFKNLRIFNEGLENLGFEQKFDINMISKKNFPYLLETAQRMHKMFKSGKKIEEKQITQEEVKRKLAKNLGKERKIVNQPPKKVEQEPLQFIQEMEKLRSNKKSPKIGIGEENQEPQHQQIEIKPSIEKFQSKNEENGEKVEKIQQSFNQNKENQENPYPDLDCAPPPLQYPSLPELNSFSNQNIQNQENEEPTLQSNTVKTVEKVRQTHERRTPEFSEVKAANKTLQEDEDDQLLSSMKVKNNNPFIKKKEEISKEKDLSAKITPVAQPSIKVNPTPESRSRSNKVLNKLGSKKHQTPSRSNPERNVSPGPSSACTNLLDLDSKNKRAM